MDFYGLFFVALILTIVIETIAMVIVLKWTKKNNWDIAWNKIIFTGFLASFATLPYLWFVWPTVFAGKYMILSGEIFVTLVEIVIIKFSLPVNWKTAVILSVICNLSSYLIGKLFF
ncbi:MAG: hypothetical protein ACOZAR_03180 [Patescibacteria group bacterium]